MSKTGQPLHRRVKSHCFSNAHRRTEEFFVAEQFDGNGHTWRHDRCSGIGQLYTPTNDIFAKHGKVGGSGPWGPLISFGNEPQGEFPVKPAQLTSLDLKNLAIVPPAIKANVLQINNYKCIKTINIMCIPIMYTTHYWS